MGEVYKARDIRLDRLVAIKVLPEHIADQEASRARFEREARAVASLNHPNICVLHDIGNDDGVQYMVMELLEGETLAARILKGAIPMQQTLTWAAQIADALDRAHRAGVTHRDVKPANLMLTRDGAKVLDFGVARSSAARLGPTEATLTQAPGEGSLLGTPRYMAPEQFEGRDGTALSDIWAFGAVVYEMVTGAKAFRGNTYTTLAASIQESEPAPMPVEKQIPAALDRLVRRCLAKDPDERYQSMRDVVLDLRWIASAPARDPVEAGQRSRWRWALPAALAAALAIVSAIHFREKSVDPLPAWFEASVPEAKALDWFQYPSVSPDGSLIAFPAKDGAGQMALWLRSLGSQKAQMVTAAGGWDYCWSSDSKTLTYATQQSVTRMEINRGQPQSLARIDQTPYGLACSPRAILTGSPQGPLLRLTPAGGDAKPATKLVTADNQTAHRYPQFLPDGAKFLYTAVSASGGGVFAGSLDSPEVKRILPGAIRAVYVPNGYLLYPSGQALVAQKFDWRSLEFSGEPMLVVDHVYQFSSVPGYAGFSASSNVLAYRGQGPVQLTEMTWYDRAGKRIGTLGEPMLYTNPVFSPDGRRLAVNTGVVSPVGRDDPAYGKRDIWVIDMTRGTNTRLTFDPADDLNPVWSADGNEVFFSSDRGGGRQLYRKPVSGVIPERPFGEGGGRNSAEAVSPDGKWVLYNDGLDIRMIPTAGGKAEVVLGGPGRQDQSAVSRDGRWIAYRSDESGRREIFVQNFPPGQGRWQISTGGGQEPTWRNDGAELYYVDGAKLMAVAIRASGNGLEAGKPVLLFEAPFAEVSRRNRFVVDGNGSRFLIVTEFQQASPDISFHVLMNWLSVAKRSR